MTLSSLRGVVNVLVLLPAAVLSAAGVATAQETKAPAKTAVQQFKNIEVLKDIPADELIPTMQFIAGALGVDCEFCHVQHAMDKDDKKEKKIARKMMEMELTLNADRIRSAFQSSRQRPRVNRRTNTTMRARSRQTPICPKPM
jgi:Photosynthetic reaction centre cytochrome C subunit